MSAVVYRALSDRESEARLHRCSGEARALAAGEGDMVDCDRCHDVCCESEMLSVYKEGKRIMVCAACRDELIEEAAT